MDHTYWKQQTASKPLFPDMEWSRPERRDQAGRLGIIGGNKLGFAGVAASYTTALETGVGDVRVLLPDALKGTIPKSITDTVYGASTPSGSLASDALNDMLALGAWGSGILLAGDAGRNSETAILYEKFIQTYDGPLVITRDAIDLVKNGAHVLVERPQTMLVASFAQVQKLFQGIYYPKILTFSMQLMQLVDALHKFTLTYPVTLVTFHRERLIVAHGGEVVTHEFNDPMLIWRGVVAAKASSYLLWSPSRPLEAIAASFCHKT